MRTKVIGLPLILATALSANAQRTQRADKNWDKLQTIAPGTAIHVRTRKARVACTLGSVDADSLTCANADQVTFSRMEVRSVTVPHPRRHQLSSTLIGGAVAGAIGAVVGLFYTAEEDNYWVPPQQRVGLGWGALTGAAIFDGTAAVIEFWPRTETVYKAP